MARPPRIEYPGAFYHVIVRGNQGQNIFSDRQDRIEYLNRVMHYKHKCGFVLYAYVLMSNHVHLLVETTTTPLSKIMQFLNFTYTRRFNRKYGKTGHLFQGRYKAFLCDRDTYLLALVRYIHLNPVRAGIVRWPHEYEWSSHGDYLGRSGRMVDPDRVLRLFSENPSEARKLYGEFVVEAIGAGKDNSLYKAIDQQILGDEKFIEKVEGKRDNPGKPMKRPALHAILKAVEEVTGVTREDIASRSRKDELFFARGLLVSVWREAGYKLTALTPVLKRELSMLSRLAKFSDNDRGRAAMKKVLRMLESRNQA